MSERSCLTALTLSFLTDDPLCLLLQFGFSLLHNVRKLYGFLHHLFTNFANPALAQSPAH